MSAENFSQLKKLILFLWTSPLSDFYRKKYEADKFNPERDLKDIESFKKVPYLSRQELAAVTPSQRLFFKPEGFWYQAHTSGTTKQRPAFFYFKLDRLEKPNLILPNQFKNVLFLNHPSRLPRFLRALNAQGALFTIGDINNLPLAAIQAREAKVNCIFSSPTLLVVFAEHLKNHYDPAKIKYIRCVGELMTPKKYSLLKSLFQNAEIESAYAMVETGTMGFQCPNLIGSEQFSKYHARNDRFYFETLKSGELIVSNLKFYDRFGTPLVRYRTGDVLVFDQNPCGCGRAGLVFKIEGRAGFDFIKIGGGVISETELERAIKFVERLLPIKDYMLSLEELAENDKLKVKLSLKLETNLNLNPPLGDINKIFSENFRIGANSSLKDAVEKGFFAPLEVSISENPLAQKGLKQTHIVNNLLERSP
jgi:phenylacetate-coenzyme A ligase PaaK-like adenylate-forming protein